MLLRKCMWITMPNLVLWLTWKCQQTKWYEWEISCIIKIWNWWIYGVQHCAYSTIIDRQDGSILIGKCEITIITLTYKHFRDPILNLNRQESITINEFSHTLNSLEWLLSMFSVSRKFAQLLNSLTLHIRPSLTSKYLYAKNYKPYSNINIDFVFNKENNSSEKLIPLFASPTQESSVDFPNVAQIYCTVVFQINWDDSKL